MKITTNTILAAFGLIAFAMLAGLPIVVLAAPRLYPSQPTPDAFATVQAIVQQTTVAMTQNAPTSLPATATPLPPTSTPVPTTTPLPTATTAAYCDWVTFVKDVTILDGTKFGPGDVFTKT